MKLLFGMIAALLFVGAAEAANEPFQTFLLGQPAVSSITGTEVMYCSQGGTSKQCTPTQLLTFINANGAPNVSNATGTLPCARQPAYTGVITVAVGTCTSSLTGALVLPNGSTATTQAATDTSTDVATDAFVAALFASPPGFGSTTPAAVNATTFNMTGSTGLNIVSKPIVNALSNQSSPIESPETLNAPNANSAYFPNPIVVGYSNTLSSGTSATYQNQITDNLAISGTSSAHWGEMELTINLSGTGTAAAEINGEKFYITIPSTVSNTAQMEPIETAINNLGTNTGALYGLLDFVTNGTGGTIAKFDAVWTTYTNNSATAGAFNTFRGLECGGNQGSGSAATNSQCVYNGDNLGEITNTGVYGARPGAALSCNANCTLGSRASNATFTITEGTAVTSAVVTFGVTYPGQAPQCTVSSPNGATWTSYSMTQTTFTINNVSATGNQYTVTCWAAY